jgi:hypothetical protein
MKKRVRFDGDDTVEDREVVRVPLLLMDGSTVDMEPWQRDVILAARLGLEDGESLHPPGFRFCDAAGAEAKAKALLQAQQEICDAWRNPTRDADPIGGFGSREMSGKVGDVCTVSGPEYPLDHGSPGHFERRGGQLVCVPDVPRKDSQSMDVRDIAYAESVRSLCDAWRGK